MKRKHVEVGVVLKDGRIGVNCESADEVVDQLANGLPFPAREAKQGGCMLTKRSRAPANTSIPTASQIAISLVSNGSKQSQVGDPVSRRNPTHASHPNLKFVA